MNKKIIRIVIALVIAVAVSLPLFYGCVQSPGSISHNIIVFTDYRDIPGVTEEQIQEIEAIKAERDSFTAGMFRRTLAFEDENDELSGFIPLMFEWMSELFGIEFVPELMSWPDFWSGMESGEVDFGYHLVVDEDFEQFYMTQSPIALLTAQLFTFWDSPPLEYISMMRPLRIAYMPDAPTLGQVYRHIEPGTVELFPVRGVDNVLQMLLDDEIDAYLTDSMGQFSFDALIGADDRSVVGHDFQPLTYSPLFLLTSVTELQVFIDVMELALQNGARRHLTALFEEGEQAYKRARFYSLLTDEQLRFIEETPVIYITAPTDRYPSSFFNRRENEWQGVAFDILHEVSRFTDMTFEVAHEPGLNFPDMRAMLEKGEVAMSSDFVQAAVWRDVFLWSSVANLPDRFLMISRNDLPFINIKDLDYMTVGMVSASAFYYIFNEWFPDHPAAVYYNNFDEGFQGLASGEIDLLMASENRLLALTHYHEEAGYKANIVLQSRFDTRMAFNADEKQLFAIFENALRLIDTESIADNWLRKSFDYRLMFAEAQTTWLMVLSVMALTVLTLVAILLIRTRRAGRRLEVLVEERTHDAVKAREAADMANEAKSTFLATMSHELRTPMNSIVGFSELALDDEVPPKTRNYLDNIQSSSKLLLQIISDVLDISKIESGKMELENIPFDLHELFTNCRIMTMPKAIEKNLKLHFYAEPSVGRIPMGDPVKLRQALLNLLSNAVKFTNSGTVKVLALIKETGENYVTMRFEVTDSGVGMTAEQIDRIFDSFVQAETGTMRKFGGTGLGLAITKSIIELMGGKLMVESTPRVGSKFSFELTFETVDLDKRDLVETKILNEDMRKPTFSGDILLCEDNAMNQQVICEHLARVGLKTVVAENGKIGVDIVKSRMQNGEKPFDLIFMDIHMPEMDGLEATEQILALGVTTPIVALTANIMTHDIALYKERGMKTHVSKPFTSQELWLCLMKYFAPIGWQEDNGIQSRKEEGELRQKLINKFVSTEQNRFGEIKQALKANDIKLAHRMAHTLKTNAAQLGKMMLQQAAESVETALKDGENLVKKKQLEVLETELAAALTELAPLVYELPQVEPHESLSAEETKELFDKLHPMLKENDTECLMLIEKLRMIPETEDLIKHMENFDFVPAMDALAKLKKKEWS